MNLFELNAKLGLNKDDYEKGIESAGATLKKFGSGIAKVAKISAAGISAAATGVAALTKQATESFANYEQLAGGIETMFEDLSYDVAENASKAFKTAGLSVNDYYETVMGFSASLNASLIESEGNISRSAELSDQIIIDMADNANKMGSSMESIQNAYSGFAKQNYTMLDNLKLGYGGTQAEMQRLIEDAEKIDGNFKAMRDETGALKMSFTDVAEAIHIVQTDLNITGTTAKEASETISGSMASMQAAWANLLTGIADDSQDFDALIDNLVESAVTFGDNILPRIETALEGVGKLVEKLMPKVLERIPDVLSNMLPKLINSALKIVNSVFRAIETNMPAITQTLADIITTIAGWIGKAPELMDLAVELVSGVGGAVLDNLPLLLKTAVEMVLALSNYLIEALPQALPQLVTLIADLAEMLTEPETLTALIDTGIALIFALTDGFINALPVLLDRAPAIIETLVNAVVENFPKILDCAWQVIKELTNGLLINMPQIVESGKDIIDNLGYGITSMLLNLDEKLREVQDTIIERFKEAIGFAKEWGKDLLGNFIDGVKEKLPDVAKNILTVAETVADYIHFSEPEKGPLSDFHTSAPDMMEMFASGIKESESKLKAQLESTAAIVANGFSKAPKGEAQGVLSGGNVFNITITAGTIASDYDARRAAQIMSEELSNLKSLQSMAVGA